MTAPDLTAAKEYLGQSGLSFTEDQVAGALAAETAAQAAVVKVGTYPQDITEALLRRVARNLAMRNLPLGVQQDEAGGIRIGMNDPEIRRLEAPHRKRVVA